MDRKFSCLEEAAGYYYEKQECNCTEALLAGGNRYYSLGICDAGLRTAAGFGAGMAVGSVCGALTGAVMVMGNLFVKQRSHESDAIVQVTRSFLEVCIERFHSIDCAQLKERFYRPGFGCLRTVQLASQAAEEIIDSFKDLRVR